MNKLEMVREFLSGRRDILVAKAIETDGFGRINPSFVHSADFWVCPREPLFDVKELQSLMMSLVPHGLDLTCKDDFYRPDYRWALKIGKLYFDEDLNKEQKRRIWVRLFPSKRIIDAIDSGDIFSQYEITPVELLRYGRGCKFAERIRNILGARHQKHVEANADKNIYFLSGGGY